MVVNDILKAQSEALSKIENEKTLEGLENLRVEYLGKKGLLNILSKDIPTLTDKEKKEVGVSLNKAKSEITSALGIRKKELTNSSTKDNPIDLTLPGNIPPKGSLHITTTAIREITEIFKKLGFTRVRYPEVELDYYAFEALNMPKNHPARDEWETFFITDNVVLTPHTSSGQVREMEKGKLPIRMINISRCDRRQSDVSHGTTFFQFEGLLIDKGINITHLIGVIDYFVKHFYGPNRKIRLRPTNFRFTEPSFEIDINCALCEGRGCRFCKEGWMELGGSGMVHPNVLKAGKIDPEKFSGFAFGWGVERTYLMKSGVNIDDIRIMYRNDLRFLKQF
ncbi:phenylalanine--tRNA ligase subunit alpha [candidate division WWE3 bacterium CG_4_10_14_0_2_um_filter_42_7]|uniref:Phenylalanine--tRNA ligase alpha subunit n=2 Tax=Katanobacteria TaxID=422282 RepID=A0A2M7TE99_UNCKA|nr:MAG: phenylalanine--tRNA ligase subunit alpha [candidate division WWE3 bacterium CG_4_10_14_0_2_um_filter_42_7]